MVWSRMGNFGPRARDGMHNKCDTRASWPKRIYLLSPVRACRVINRSTWIYLQRVCGVRSELSCRKKLLPEKHPERDEARNGVHSYLEASLSCFPLRRERYMLAWTLKWDIRCGDSGRDTRNVNELEFEIGGLRADKGRTHLCYSFVAWCSSDGFECAAARMGV